MAVGSTHATRVSFKGHTVEVEALHSTTELACGGWLGWVVVPGWVRGGGGRVRRSAGPSTFSLLILCFRIRRPMRPIWRMCDDKRRIVASKSHGSLRGGSTRSSIGIVKRFFRVLLPGEEGLHACFETSRRDQNSCFVVGVGNMIGVHRAITMVFASLRAKARLWCVCGFSSF